MIIVNNSNNYCLGEIWDFSATLGQCGKPNVTNPRCYNHARWLLAALR